MVIKIFIIDVVCLHGLDFPLLFTASASSAAGSTTPLPMSALPISALPTERLTRFLLSVATKIFPMIGLAACVAFGAVGGTFSRLVMLSAVSAGVAAFLCRLDG